MSHTKGADGKYHISGKSYHVLIGTRAQVWHGTAYKTAGGLTKGDLMQNKAGRIVSRAKHSSAKKEMRLLKHGYGTKKGKFGYVKVGSRSRSRKSRRSRSQRGGSGMSTLSPADVNAPTMIADVVPQDFSPLDRALVGGRSRSRSASRGRSRSASRGRSARGGAPYGNPFVPADAMGSGIAGQGITDFSSQGSVGVQLAAGMAGGARRSRARSARRARAAMRSRGASRSRALAARGGTADRRFGVFPSGPTISALNA